eukprot:1189510-Prorocentrum_minimum.AAC.2
MLTCAASPAAAAASTAFASSLSAFFPRLDFFLPPPSAASASFAGATFFAFILSAASSGCTHPAAAAAAPAAASAGGHRRNENVRGGDVCASAREREASDAPHQARLTCLSSIPLHTFVYLVCVVSAGTMCPSGGHVPTARYRFGCVYAIAPHVVLATHRATWHAWLRAPPSPPPPGHPTAAARPAPGAWLPWRTASPPPPQGAPPPAHRNHRNHNEMRVTLRELCKRVP